MKNVCCSSCHRVSKTAHALQALVHLLVPVSRDGERSRHHTIHTCTVALFLNDLGDKGHTLPLTSVLFSELACVWTLRTEQTPNDTVAARGKYAPGMLMCFTVSNSSSSSAARYTIALPKSGDCLFVH